MNNHKKEELQRLLWMANVQGFYPDKPAVELEAGYQRWKDHRQRFAKLDVDFPAENVLLKSPNLEPGSLSGSIVFTFHYGPYRLLPRYLVAAGYQLTIVVSAAVLNRERRRYASDLSAMGLPAHRLECLEATNALVIRKMLQAIARNRLILVFLDANETVGSNESKVEQERLRISFGASYFYWRSNLLKLAHRFGLPVHAMHLSSKLHQTRATWQVEDPLTVLAPADKNNPMALLKTFTKLQEYFQAMMQQDWTAWENWGLMHHYKGFDERNVLEARNKGGWMIPFSFADKGYLFDLSSKLFYEIIVKKDNII